MVRAIDTLRFKLRLLWAMMLRWLGFFSVVNLPRHYRDQQCWVVLEPTPVYFNSSMANPVPFYFDPAIAHKEVVPLYKYTAFGLRNRSGRKEYPMAPVTFDEAVRVATNIVQYLEPIEPAEIRLMNLSTYEIVPLGVFL